MSISRAPTANRTREPSARADNSTDSAPRHPTLDPAQIHTAERTLEGIQVVNMMRKGQVKRLAGSDAQGQARFVASLFQIAA